MNDKALKVLEFHKIIELLAERATSEPGRKMCLGLRPSVVRSTIESCQQETEDATSRLLRRGATNFGSNKDLLISMPWSPFTPFPRRSGAASFPRRRLQTMQAAI